MPSLGYVYEHPEAVASQTSTKHWPMELLLAGVPVTAAPLSFRCSDLRPAALDQDGVGACVAFAATLIRDTQDAAPDEWGKHLYATGTITPPTGAFLAYRWLKDGYKSYPGDGLPGVEGSYPEQVWKLAKAEGIPDAKGVPHKISAYYSHSLANDADVAFLQQVLMALGPVNLATPWPAAWMAAPKGPDYLMPPISGSMVGGHSYTIVGWTTIGGVVHLTCMNSWGYWGSAQGIFQFPASWCFNWPFGPQVIWKTVDAEDAPIPPTPTPEGPMLVRVDKTPRLVDSAVGKNLYAADGTTVLVPISSGALNLNSPSAYGTIAGGPITHFSVEITSKGIPQLAWLNRNDCTNIRVIATDPAAVEAARKAGEATGAKAVKDAAIAEALMYGG